METKFLKEALFTGMTSNAFKLGTVLSLGWFWMRMSGCLVLYRGLSMEQVDFTNMLVVAEQDVRTISSPSYVQHNNSSIYFYVVRRVNNCGQQEHTLAAAVKVSINDTGDLAQPRPNSIFGVRAEQLASDKIQLIWFYCPIDQNQQPMCFKVYSDEGAGQIDYGDPIATFNYEGRKFYALQTNLHQADTYLLAIRAQGADGMEDASLARLRIQLNISNPDEINILSIETI